MTETHKAVHCHGNLRTIGLALWRYADQHDGKFPVVREGLEILVAEGLLQPRDLCCPGAPLGEPSYVYRPGYDSQQSAVIPICWERPANHEKTVHVLLSAGAVLESPKDGFSEALRSELAKAQPPPYRPLPPVALFLRAAGAEARLATQKSLPWADARRLIGRPSHRRDRGERGEAFAYIGDGSMDDPRAAVFVEVLKDRVVQITHGEAPEDPVAAGWEPVPPEAWAEDGNCGAR